MSATEPQLDRRELASIRAGLKLLQWADGPDSRILPIGVRIAVANVSEEGGAFERLSSFELAELVRRLA